jgi:hypothetical protein
MRAVLLAAAFAAVSVPAFADDAVSVERGRHISIIGGCHDCHTVGYNESGGKIDPATALKGSPLGYRGPWGTTYAMNLRITASTKSEDEFVTFAQSFETRPPMPWYNVHEMEENDLRSLYQYIKSLGEPGDPAPQAADPGAEPATPYIIFAPPVLPKT